MADALASGASVRKDVGVQVPPRAPRLLMGRVTARSRSPCHELQLEYLETVYIVGT